MKTHEPGYNICFWSYSKTGGCWLHCCAVSAGLVLAYFKIRFIADY